MIFHHISKAGTLALCKATEKPCPLGDSTHYSGLTPAQVKDTNQTLTVIRELSTSEDYELLEEVYYRNHDNPVVATQLLNNPQASLSLKEAISTNPDNDPTVLRVVASNENPDIRKWAALNPNTDPETLTRLSQDTDFVVRTGAAINPNTPETVLTQLAGDNEEWVRAAVAYNPSTPEETLQTLKAEDSELIRMALAENPKYQPITESAEETVPKEQESGNPSQGNQHSRSKLFAKKTLLFILNHINRNLRGSKEGAVFLNMFLQAYSTTRSFTSKH